MTGHRIAIDALGNRFGGSAYAMIQLAKTLERRDDVAAVMVIAGRGSIVTEGLADSSLELVVVDLPPCGQLLWRAAWSAVRLPVLMARWQPSALIAGAGMLPRMPSCPVVAMLWNPAPFEAASGLDRLRCSAIGWTARRARAAAVPTQHMADIVGAALGVEPVVVELAVDRHLFSPAVAAGEEILVVSDFYAHKRHDIALAAYQRLPQPRPVMRFIGNPDADPANYAALLEAVTRLEAERVVIQSSVSRTELIDAYRHARVFLMPSERESFSMPLAEAMCCGIPAVAREHPALRETGGPGTAFVTGDRAEEWAAEMTRLLTDDDLHRERRAAAVRQGERFSWELMAQRTLALVGNT